MPFVPPNPTQEELNRWFSPEIPAPSAGVFEVGLVLGGTVSAGAYTAGFLDFLIEALDAWTVAKEAADPLAPPHRLVLKVTTGASGGGVNAAILSRLTPFAFPHVRATDARAATGNPFFDIWVNQFDIGGMLSLSDLAGGQPLVSALNTAPIDEAAASLVAFNGQPLGADGTGTPKVRSWLDDTLSMFVTLTNLRGVPFQISLAGGPAASRRWKQSIINHADFARFEIDTRPGVTTLLRPDSFGVSLWRNDPGFIPWSAVKDFAIATGAFPVGFKARDLQRPMSHYAYRVVTVPGDSESDAVHWLQPDWGALADANGEIPDTYYFPSVDGGAIDNEPIELSRTTLAGAVGRNPRSGSVAQRAVVLVDPFADPASLGPKTIDNLGSVFAPFLTGLIGQTRYDTADLALATDETIFSRFLVAASRGDLFGTPALATGGLAAFAGFLCRDFREHDFLLGRRNAYEFLKEHFCLPADNERVFGRWTSDQRAHYAASGNGPTFLPIIPLVGDLATAPPFPAWPADRIDPNSLRQGIDARIKKLASVLEDDEISKNIFVHAALAPVISIFGARLTDRCLAAIEGALKASIPPLIP